MMKRFICGLVLLGSLITAGSDGLECDKQERVLNKKERFLARIKKERTPIEDCEQYISNMSTFEALSWLEDSIRGYEKQLSSNDFVEIKENFSSSDGCTDKRRRVRLYLNVLAAASTCVGALCLCLATGSTARAGKAVVGAANLAGFGAVLLGVGVPLVPTVADYDDQTNKLIKTVYADEYKEWEDGYIEIIENKKERLTELKNALFEERMAEHCRPLIQKHNSESKKHS